MTNDKSTDDQMMEELKELLAELADVWYFLSHAAVFWSPLLIPITLVLVILYGGK